MADQVAKNPNVQKTPKSPHAEREERILAFWQEKGIFEKTLEKTKNAEEFVFYEGPPTANGRPGIHHLEARAFKDAIPRYKTMRGFYVRRKGGWDAHGLPVELQVEKELGLKSKKEIENFGIAAFNQKCKDSVWTYVHEWEDFTNRMGYWIDLQHPYITYKPNYIESLWNIVKKVDQKKLLYKDYKVVPWCPRCGTALSSHELAQGYENVKDLSVTVKFGIRNTKSETNSKFEFKNKTSLLAWTTTPWTLPGNLALAVNSKLEYSAIKLDGSEEVLIMAKDRVGEVTLGHKVEVVHDDIKGSDLVGLSYEPIYTYLRDNLTGAEKEKLKNAFQVYAADFVTTDDGTGIVHIAPMYGQDDFELGTKVNLPKYHLVNDDGTFKIIVGIAAGEFVKDEKVTVEIIKDLAHRGLLFHKEKHEHSYPFCWRCHTPLIYFARDSWYIRMSDLRAKLVKENEGIHWEPEHIREGRFGEWLRDVKDWAISRERYWGTPLPVWSCDTCHKRHVVGSVEEVTKKPKNTYYVMRHGEAEFNVKEILSCDADAPNHLTELGKKKIAEHMASLKREHIDLIIASPFVRTLETARIVQKMFGLKNEQLLIDARIHEMTLGEGNGMHLEEFMKVFPMNIGRFTKAPTGAETYAELKKRMGDFLYDIEQKYSGKKILIVTHGSPAMMLIAAARGWDREQAITYEMANYIQKGHYKPLEFRIVPHNEEYELDLHRPFIDSVKLSCSCGGTMSRAKEVMDVWFDSGAMPFAQDHYPFNKGTRNNEQGKNVPFSFFPFSFFAKQKLSYPADFISEAIDQTRGWFYTLHAIGTLMDHGKAYKNVICLGHILDADGKKMSKSLGNVVNPFDMMNLYGADALRFWMYSVNQPGDSKNFEEKTVDEVVKKVFNLATNVVSFYRMYETDTSKVKSQKSKVESQNILDQWILAKLNQLIETVTKGLDSYVFLEPTRAIRDFIADLSQWYLRRSRDRFKGDDEKDKQSALETTKHVLLTLAKVMAPFTPFFAEQLYKDIGGSLESVHLETWPMAEKYSSEVISSMELVRSLASKALEARTKAKINVRQPLAKLKVRTQKSKLSQSLIEVLLDEVNVKGIVIDDTIQSDVELDTTITPELKEEGDLREFLRKIQDLRKERGLKVGDQAVLIIAPEYSALVSKFADQIKKTTNIQSFEEGTALALKA